MVTADAVAQAVSMAAVAVGESASAVVALEPSSCVTSLQGFDVSYDSALNHLIRCHQHRLRSSGQGPIVVQGSSYLQ